jgi:hypothetical protein
VHVVNSRTYHLSIILHPNISQLFGAADTFAYLSEGSSPGHSVEMSEFRIALNYFVHTTSAFGHSTDMA